MTPAQVQSAALECFGITRDQLFDHDRRGEDEMDARAMIAWVLVERLGFSGRRAAMFLGYSETSASATYVRLRGRVRGSPRLRFDTNLLFPAARAA